MRILRLQLTESECGTDKAFRNITVWEDISEEKYNSEKILRERVKILEDLINELQVKD